MFREAVSRLKSSFEDLNDEKYITRNTLAIGLVVCIVVYWWMRTRKYNLPPGPTGFPILGYLPFLSKELYKDFHRISKKYGNVLGLRLGRTYVVVLEDYETVKEVLNHTAAMGRPSVVFDFAPDGGGFSTSNSTEWTEQRRFAVRAMRDIGLGGSKWEALIQEEIEDIVKVVEQRNGSPDDYSKLFAESMCNNITTLVFGKRLPAGQPDRKLVLRIVELAIEESDVAALKNFLPAVVVDGLAMLGIGGKRNHDVHSKFIEFTNFLKKQVDERKKVYKNENLDIFIDGYLKEIENNERDNLNNTFSERNLRGNILSLLAAGTDTTTESLLWLLIAMAQFPEIQGKVHRELDSVLGKEGRAKFTERNKLPYTYAVLQEAGRWATITPLGVVRLVTEKFKINEYDVPKGSLILPNFYAMHKNPMYWKEPEKFIPERFLSNDGLPIASKTDGYIPFSIGKRNCPGETVAKISIFLYFAALMQKFKVQAPVGKAPKLEGLSGVVYRPVPQELRFVPRE